ncbi:hypothetical protein OPU89_00570, partial [Klebsiella pneumoniae]|nr:hypothetical protein [Klebsiella pneumoniae]
MPCSARVRNTSLFASSFLSATLLPGNSEVVLVAM